MAPPAAPLAGAALDTFRTALLETCTELARAIPTDGEGATHLITLEVTGCRDQALARQIARTVADSALVKTAIAGADPNWGRIVSAAGYAGVEFEPRGVHLRINEFLLYEAGAGRLRRGASFDFDSRTSRHAHRARLFRGHREHPLLDDRPHGRVRAAERGLSHLVAV